MIEPTLGRRIIAGQAGMWALPVQAVLRVGEFAYSGLMRIRNRRYDAPGQVIRVAVPVISVGNITVGGTGKTPMVIELTRRLELAGRNPAIVARGYGGVASAPSDEELLIRKACPAVAYVCESNRFRGADLAIKRMGADVIVLDDAFQHRRLHRDLDIVLIDALCPFGFGHVLPRGLLREPLSGLARAQVAIVTRFDQAPQHELQKTEAVFRNHNHDAPIIRSRTKVSGIEYLDAAPVADIGPGMRVLAFAGIGRPQGFAATLASLGLEVVATRWWPDHHPYRQAEIMRMLEDPRNPPYDLAMTTEKDAVKIVQLKGLDPRVIGVVRIGLEFPGGGDAVLNQLVEQAVGHTPVTTA